MNKLFASLVYIAFILLSFCSCEIIDKEEEIPSYIHIDSISLKIDSAAQGSSSHKITDAWVYIDNALIGVFELPVTFPVLKSGSHEILVRAGIKMNGIAATRIEYPFYNFYSGTVNLIPGSVIPVKPEVHYFPAIKFPFVEDFESTGFNFTSPSISSDTALQITTDPSLVFEGTKSGAAYLDDSSYTFITLSSSSFTEPVGVDVYLELNYKCNQEFSAGIYTDTDQYLHALTINPNDKWNKIYINVTNAARIASGSFKIYFKMENNKGVTKPTLFIDNIKLVHQ